MVIEIIYRKSGMDGFKSRQIETQNDVLADALKAAFDYTAISRVLEEHQESYTEVHDVRADLKIDLSSVMEKNTRQMKKAFGSQSRY